MTESALSMALRRFEETEANLNKLERLWAKARALIPSGVSFGDDPDYEDTCRAISVVAEHLPKIEGWRPTLELMDLNAIAQSRWDYMELQEPEAQMSFEIGLDEPGKELREYRFRFNQKRRELVRGRVLEIEALVDAILIKIGEGSNKEDEPSTSMSSDDWESLRQYISEIDTLLGSSVSRPPRWSDMRRHVGFAQLCDYRDICEHDWPSIKKELRSHLYGEDEPIPVGVEDLAQIIATKPSGVVATKLSWSTLTADEFERLVFALISNAEGYENPEWLMSTHAPDQGRDLSVSRIVIDKLSGTRRLRVMLQCKHWLSRSVSVADVATLKEQVRLWGNPRFDVLVIVTSGRFSADAVRTIESHNESDAALRIEMWPESHLERLLAARPGLIAEFRLRTP